VYIYTVQCEWWKNNDKYLWWWQTYEKLRNLYICQYQVASTCSGLDPWCHIGLLTLYCIWNVIVQLDNCCDRSCNCDWMLHCSLLQCTSRQCDTDMPYQDKMSLDTLCVILIVICVSICLSVIQGSKITALPQCNGIGRLFISYRPIVMNSDHKPKNQVALPPLMSYSFLEWFCCMLPASWLPQPIADWLSITCGFFLPSFINSVNRCFFCFTFYLIFSLLFYCLDVAFIKSLKTYWKALFVVVWSPQRRIWRSPAEAEPETRLKSDVNVQTDPRPRSWIPRPFQGLEMLRSMAKKPSIC